MVTVSFLWSEKVIVTSNVLKGKHFKSHNVFDFLQLSVLEKFVIFEKSLIAAKTGLNQDA